MNIFGSGSTEAKKIHRKKEKKIKNVLKFVFRGGLEASPVA
jgi:hypothetical protein